MKQDKQLDEEGVVLQEYVIARASHKLYMSVWIQVSTCGCNAMHDTSQSFETLHLWDSLYNIADLQAKKQQKRFTSQRLYVYSVYVSSELSEAQLQ